jgi:hypothetical protein
MPTGYLPISDSLSEKPPVVSDYDETTGDLVHDLLLVTAWQDAHGSFA